MMQREAVRISWKVYQRLGLTKKEKNIAKVAEKMYCKQKPGIKKICSRYTNHKNNLFEATGVNYIDHELDELLKVEMEKDVDCELEGKKRLQYLCRILMKCFDL